MSTEIKQSPIIAYYLQRLKDVGLTEENNHREVFNADGRPQTIPIFCYKEDKDWLEIPYVRPDGTQEFYAEGKKEDIPYTRIRYRIPREYKDSEGKIKKQRYNQPPKTGVRAYCPPAIVEKYRKKENIQTLIIVEGEFKSIAGSINGMDIIGIGGMQNYCNKETNELESNISQVIRTCNVQNVILLLDADCLRVEYKDKKDLAIRLQNFHSAVTRFSELVRPFDVDLYFAHVQTKYLGTAKGLDDLLALPGVDKERVNRELEKLSTGEKIYFSIQRITASSTSKLMKYFLLDNVSEFYEANKEVIQDKPFIYKGSRYYWDGSKVVNAWYDDARQYLRVGISFYKKVWKINPHKDPTHQKPQLVLEPWQVGEINRDYSNSKVFIQYIPKYDQFCNLPDNTKNYKRIVEIEHEGILTRCYNMYTELNHEMEPGEWPNIDKFLRHIFQSKNTSGETMYEFGLDYIQLTYFNPTQRLPILCPVSRERNTGKSTFLNFLQIIFQENMSILDNERFTGKFTSHFVHKLVVALDEGFIPIEQKLMKERIKNYSTGRTVWLEGKGSNASEIYNFMHLIMCSNDETNFMQIDEGENRFCVLKVPTLSFDDPGILQKMEQEIPHFLHFLKNRTLHYPTGQGRFSFNPVVYETEALRVIQERTQNFLPKQVKDFFNEMFRMTGEAYLEYSPKDIVRGIYEFSNTKISKPAIMDYLKFDLNLRPQPKGRYTLYKESLDPENTAGYETVSITGYPYRFFYKDFLDAEEQEEQEAMMEKAEQAIQTVSTQETQLPFPPADPNEDKPF